MASSPSTSPSSEPPPAPLAFSLLDLPALVVSTHILPRLPASAVGSFACTCRAARDAARDDERLWRLLSARRLALWCPGAAGAPAGAWRLRPPLPLPLRQREAGESGEEEGDGGSDSGTDEDGEGEEPAPPPPPPTSYRELYSRLLGWSVPGAMLGPLAASADAALGPAPLAGDNRERGPIAPSSSSGPFQDPRYWGESRRETAARRPFGSLISFEPDLKTGSVVGYALSPTLEMSTGFLRTPLFEIVPARRSGQRPRALCLRFRQQAAELLARNRREAAAAAAASASAASAADAAPSARRRRARRRHFEAHRASLSVTWGEETDCRDRFDLACQAFLEAEARCGAEGCFFSGLSSSSLSSSSVCSPPSPRRPAVLLGPCEASCHQMYQEAVCRSEAVVASRLLPPPRAPLRQQQQPQWRGGRGVPEEEEEGGEIDVEGSRFGPNVAPAVQGIGRAAPPLGRLGDGSCCCDGEGGDGNGSHCGCGGGGVSALPNLSGDRTTMDLLLAMGGIDMEPVGRKEGEEKGETVLYEPMEKFGLAPQPRTTKTKAPAPPPPRSSPLSFSSPLQSQLEGVWKGDYGAHGVEVVRIERFPRPEELDAALEVLGGDRYGRKDERSTSLLAAIKLTGDANVPAGAVSFALRGSLHDCSPYVEYGLPSGFLSLNGDGGRELRAAVAASHEGLLPRSDLLSISSVHGIDENGVRGKGAALSVPEGWHCEHDLRTADPSPLTVRGHWPAFALVSARGFSSPTTIPAQIVSVSRDCFFVAWGGGMRKLSLFTRVYANEMQWAGPEGAR